MKINFFMKYLAMMNFIGEWILDFLCYSVNFNKIFYIILFSYNFNV